MAAWIKMSLGIELGLGPGDFALDGDPAPPFPKGEQSLQKFFGPYLLWPNGWMPLGMEVGLSQGDFVLDGDPAPTPKGAEPHPIFGPRLLWPNGCMDKDATWYGGRPQPTRHCVR